MALKTAIPVFQPQMRITAADHMNPIRDDIVDLDTRLVTAEANATKGATAYSTTTAANTGNAALGTRITNLESVKPAGYYFGAWTDDNAGGGQSKNSSETGSGAKVTEIGATQLETPSGCSMTSGTFTANIAGKWDFKLGVQFGNGPTGVRAIYLAKGNAASNPTGAKYGLVGVPQADAMSTSARLTLTAGQTVSVYFAVWTGADRVQVWKAQGNMLTATWLGP